MDAQQFLGIEATDDPARWRQPVTPAVSTPGRFLFGGCGLGSGIAALESVSGRPVVWATAQYLSFAPTGSVLYWTVEPAVSGRHITQARAVGHVDDTEILTVNAALAEHIDSGVAGGTWMEAPDVPDPDQCPVRERPELFEETIFSRVEQRLAAGEDPMSMDATPGNPRAVWWFHIPGHLEPSAATLAIVGDYVSGGVSQPVGRPTMSRSLDNTLRVAALVPTEWLLCDVQIHSVTGGFAHGLAHLYAEDRTYLGTASQSMSVRPWNNERIEQMRARSR
ncbi:MAG: thioesterase family protein [Actinomycetota bacterium]|jgi:acyl-CoA thioesterase|nr:thioesterase family protein [Actinomycetota bacterium]